MLFSGVGGWGGLKGGDSREAAREPRVQEESGEARREEQGCVLPLFF
jgi:hypothetical protein